VKAAINCAKKMIINALRHSSTFPYYDVALPATPTIINNPA